MEAVKRRILIATTNRGKAAELADMLACVNVEWLSLHDFPGLPDIVEDGDTFEENARKKALGYAAAGGLWTIADDSGLVIDALDGAPGVMSARFSGPPSGGDDRQLLDHRNMAKVLTLMKDIPQKKRTARFVCCLCLAATGKILAETTGVMEGLIATAEIGQNGFGYDPIFYLPDQNRTVAQLPASQKNTLSHRGRALKKIQPPLHALLRAL